MLTIDLIFFFGLLFLVFLGLFYLKDAIRNMSPERTVYAGSSTKAIIPELEKLIGEYTSQAERQQLNFVELGSGFAWVTGAMSGRFSWKRAMGIEGAPSIWLLSQLRRRLTGQNIELLFGDIEKTILPKPALFYSYLFTPQIDNLQQDGLLDGSIFISLTFPLTHAKPVKVVPLSNWQKSLYLYDFRH